MHYFGMSNLARFLDLMHATHAIEVRYEPTIEVSRATLPDRLTIIAPPGPH